MRYSNHRHRWNTIRLAPRRRGAALLMSLFVIFFVTVMLVNVLDTETLQFSAHRNAVDYERSLYLAGAAVHHAAAQLESTPGWQGTITDGAYPADNTYEATVVDGIGNNIIITGVGVSGDTTRRLQATVVQNN